MPAASPKRVGTTTSVRCSVGIPFEKSSRGSARGGAIQVTHRFTIDTARAEKAMSPDPERSQK